MATLVGLLLSMITLAYEVWQQKKKEREQNKVIPRFESNIILQLFLSKLIKNMKYIAILITTQKGY